MGPLDFYLPYLLNRAGARIATSFNDEVRPLGATLQIWRVLAALREQRRPAHGRSLRHDLDRGLDADAPGRQHGAEGPGGPPPRSPTMPAPSCSTSRRPAGASPSGILPIAERYEAVALAGFDGRGGGES